MFADANTPLFGGKARRLVVEDIVWWQPPEQIRSKSRRRCVGPSRSCLPPHAVTNGRRKLCKSSARSARDLEALSGAENRVADPKTRRKLVAETRGRAFLDQEGLRGESSRSVDFPLALHSCSAAGVVSRRRIEWR